VELHKIIACKAEKLLIVYWSETINNIISNTIKIINSTQKQ